MSLYDDFHESMRISRQHGIPPGRVLTMYERYNQNPARVIEQCVLHPNEYTLQNLTKMKRAGLLQAWSFEALVLRHPEQFSAKTQRIAREMLEFAAAERS